MDDVNVMVSVIMPAYNAAQYIEAAIRSVKEQTVTDWELLVVDDRSKDTTAELVSRLSKEDPRICLIRNEKNLGAAGSRNKAMDVAKGKYVAFLDSDDLWYPEKLERQICLLKKTNAGLCYTSYSVVHLDSKKEKRDYIVPASVSLEDLLKQNHIGCSTVMLTADVAGKYRFASDYFHEDYVCWLTMLSNGIKAVGISDVLMDYSYYASSKSGNKLSIFKHRWSIYRKFMGYSPLKSMRYILHYMVSGIRKYFF